MPITQVPLLALFPHGDLNFTLLADGN